MDNQRTYIAQADIVPVVQYCSDPVREYVYSTWDSKSAIDAYNHQYIVNNIRSQYGYNVSSETTTTNQNILKRSN